MRRRPTPRGVGVLAVSKFSGDGTTQTSTAGGKAYIERAPGVSERHKLASRQRKRRCPPNCNWPVKSTMRLQAHGAPIARAGQGARSWKCRLRCPFRFWPVLLRTKPRLHRAPPRLAPPVVVVAVVVVVVVGGGSNGAPHHTPPPEPAPARAQKGASARAPWVCRHVRRRGLVNI